MTPHNPENLWAERLQSVFKLPLDDLVERFFLQHGEQMGSDEHDVVHINRTAGQVYLPGDLPVFVPENYEPKYAYPLIVWLGQSDQNRRGFLDLMPRISKRNYLGLALSKSNLLSASEQIDVDEANAADLADISEALRQCIGQLGEEYHVHSERIYLAGIKENAQTALQLVLDRPEWYAGAITFGSNFSKSETPLVHFRELQGKRVLLTAGSRSQSFSLVDFLATGRLLHSTGMKVFPQIYDTDDKLPNKLFSDLNEWLMNGIYESHAV